jgi:hypothetical protein
MMATRLYFNANDPGVVPFPTPAADAAWDVAATTNLCWLSEGLWNNSGSDTFTATKNTSAVQNVLALRAIYPGLAAQTITGNLKGIIRCHESIASADMSTQMVVRVYDPVTETFRGTLLAANSYALSATVDTQGYELTTVTTQRRWPSGWSGSGDALTSVDAEKGDWLVVELGFRGRELSVSTRTFTMGLRQNFGDTDAPEDETTVTTTLSSWLEFSQTLAFANVMVPEPYDGYRTIRTFAEGVVPPTTGQTWPRP